MRISILAVMLLAAHCAAKPSTPLRVESMKAISVTLQTDGGISGRGLGSIVIAADQIQAGDTRRTCQGSLNASEREQLGRLLKAAAPSSWPTFYGTADRQHGFPDAIRYVLTAEGHSTTWFGEAPAELPEGVKAIHSALWSIRNRVLRDCP